jgi:hypothetical protein
MYRLVFLSGRYQGKRLVVRQAITLVGHDAHCHLLLPDDSLLAPRHARLEERGTGVYLSSLAADLPAQRNGQPVIEPVRLAHNDLLVIGQTQIQFQDIFAPHARFRPSPGLLQPGTVLVAAAILAIEIGLLVFLVDWPRHIIRPETEAADLAWAEEARAALEAKKNAETGTVSQTAAPASVVTLPGTETAAPAPAPVKTNADGSISTAPVAATSSVAAAALEVLGGADFTPANTNTPIETLPPISAADPLIEEAQRTLAEAVAAAQFADYAKATRLLNQIHQSAPGFLPAHVEHARLLEARGNLDAAHRRWSQILGMAPEGSAFRALALKERQRLTQLQTLQTQILQQPDIPDLATLPRHIRIQPPDLQKMPVDGDVSEMRVLGTTLELAPGAPLFKEAAIQVFVTFYDNTPDGRVQPTRAITTPSPVVLGNAFADRRSLPLNATYVVPRGLRAQEQRETGQTSAYYGFTLHVFAGQILQDAAAKPKKLLDLPIHFHPAATPEP